MAATSIHAQTITLGSISPLTYCDGDTITVSYSTTGSFASDNHFFVELSNANGSFTSFTRIGNDTALNGTISFKLGSVGSDFHVKVSSTDPYAISDTNGSGIQDFLARQALISLSVRNGPSLGIQFNYRITNRREVNSFGILTTAMHRFTRHKLHRCP